MPHENVEIVSELFRAFNRRDIEAITARIEDDFEWLPAVSPGGLEGAVYRGSAGMRAWLKEIGESWSMFEARQVELIEIDARRVLALGSVLARGRASGLEMENELAQLWEIEDGSPRRATAYRSRAAGRAAAGIAAAE